MTGCIVLAKTLAISALAAGGLLMAGGQFDTGGRIADDSSGIQITADAGAQADELASTVTADVSADIQAELDAADCLDSCPAPCATACADLQRVPSDGAVEIGASFDAAVAPEHPCGCQAEVPAVEVNVEPETGATAGSATLDLEAAAGSTVGHGLGGY
jgi:hypothetical protein